MSKLVSIIEASTEHYNFIKSTWLKSFFLGRASLCENLTPDTYYYEHAKLVEACLKKSKTLVALSNDSPDVAVGYVVCEPPETLHYIYTRHSFKKFGIARALFQSCGVSPDKFRYTHRTRDAAWAVGFTRRVPVNTGEFKREFVAGLLPKGVYDPYYFLRGCQ